MVTIASPRDALAVNAGNSLAVMVRPIDGANELSEFLADRRLNAVVLGPAGGVGQGTRKMVLATLAGERAVILDADALTSFADDPALLIEAIAARADTPTVLTPHEGEFARLFSPVPEVSDVPNKLEKVVAAARHTGAVVLLKGPDTVVAEPSGRAAIAENTRHGATAGRARSGGDDAGARARHADEATCARWGCTAK